MKKVVVTGCGLVSPLGINIDEVWAKLINSESGIKKIVNFDVSDLSSQIAGQIPTSTTLQKAKQLFNATDYIDPVELKRMDAFIAYGIVAAMQAIEMSGIHNASEKDKEDIGVTIGSGIGGLPVISDTSVTFSNCGPRRVSPYFIPASLINMTAGYVGLKYAFKGPTHAVVTACASGTHAIGDAYRMIKCGEAKAMIAGSSEAVVARIGLVAFCALRALSTKYNNCAESASRPWDKGRDGFVMGEGAGVLVLEDYEYAKARGANIIAEVVGYGMSGDAHHITAPPSDGDGAFRAMRNAIKMAQINPSQIDYINAHGTSTLPGDLSELRAIERVLNNENSGVAVSSTKSAIGHLLGAAGAVEAIFAMQAINTKTIPPTLNLNDSEETFLNLTPNFAIEKNVEYAMSNSFGFGGTNACLIFKKI